MRKTALILFLTGPLLGQSSVEKSVLDNVQKIVQQGGEIVFSDLYNNPLFTAEEKAFLGRLYETFFKIPALLKSEFESTDRIPTRQDLATKLDLSVQSIELLLRVMESDRRIPPLYDRNPESNEIESLRLRALEGFIRSRGSQVKVTQWEGTNLPPFELTGFEGQKVSSRDFSGKNILIYFWFTGCPPCVRIAPLLAEVNRRYSDANFQVVGFNADRILGLATTDDERKEYLQKGQLDFLNTHVDQDTRKAFGSVNVFPTLFFVGAKGAIFRHMINFQEQGTLDRVVSELIKAD